MFCLGGFCLGGFWQGGFLSRGFLSGGLCPGGFCQGGFCPRTIEVNEFPPPPTSAPRATKIKYNTTNMILQKTFGVSYAESPDQNTTAQGSKKTTETEKKKERRDNYRKVKQNIDNKMMSKSKYTCICLKV